MAKRGDSLRIGGQREIPQGAKRARKLTDRRWKASRFANTDTLYQKEPIIYI
ncbi:hypothetical protein LCM20_12860 [Halobacillus litoralis]|uniref:hypothetical protein n=1 Tax=Halobacillus litoralis TaxID=45668 RepID=UPI001CD766FD|nr:hypothetical protein [Halobacillus litoralis]MCA0971489.1 hypothetical protein [Halobacillus litoralis]